MCGRIRSRSVIVRVARNLSRAPTASFGSAAPTLDRTRPRVAQFAPIGSRRRCGQTPFRRWRAAMTLSGLAPMYRKRILLPILRPYARAVPSVTRLKS
jgi:hypothetical protein